MTGERTRSRRWLRLLWCLGVAPVVLLLAPLALRHRSRSVLSPVGRRARHAARTAVQRIGSVRGRLHDEEQADELLTEFDVDTDGSWQFTETITWRFPEGEERHGIVRNVKVRTGYQDSDTSTATTSSRGVSAPRPVAGRPPTSRSPTSAPTGRSASAAPTQTVAGTADYVRALPARARRQRHRRRHREFYYNVVGPSSDFPQPTWCGSPSPARPRPPGRPASTAPTAPPTPCQAAAGDPARSPPPTSAAEQGASVLASYPPRRVRRPDPRPAPGRSGDAGSPAPSRQPRPGPRARLAELRRRHRRCPVLAGGLMGLLVWSRGRDEQYAGLTPGLTPGRPAGAGRGGARAARPRSPCSSPRRAGVQPGMVGTILDEEANLIDVTATVVDLAVRGHLRIEETTRAACSRATTGC